MPITMEDRRVRRTKKQLRTAFITLLQQRDLDHITVRDVAELADVNRGTFYAHYRDIHDLLCQIEDELLERMAELGKKHSVLEGDGRAGAYLSDLFALAEEYEDVCLTLCGSGGDTAFREHIRQNLLEQYIVQYRALRGRDSKKSQYAAAFAVAGIYSLLATWLQTGRKESVEEMSRLGCDFINSGVCQTP